MKPKRKQFFFTFALYLKFIQKYNWRALKKPQTVSFFFVNLFCCFFNLKHVNIPRIKYK